jgi:hypothetical protein
MSVQYVYTKGSRKHRLTIGMLHVMLVQKFSGRRIRHRASEDPVVLQYLLLGRLRTVIVRLLFVLFVSALQ